MYKNDHDDDFQPTAEHMLEIFSSESSDKTKEEVIEGFKNKQKLNIDPATVLLAKKISEEIKIVNIWSPPNMILYLQDKIHGIYKILNNKLLKSTIISELAKMNIFPKPEQIRDMMLVMKNNASAKFERYDDLANNILFLNGYYRTSKKGDTGKFTKLDEQQRHPVSSLDPICFKGINLEYHEDLYKTPNKLVNKFFDDIMNNDKELVDYLWHALATPFLPRSKYEKAFIFYGHTGSNGKTILAQLMKQIYGANNTSHVELAEMKGWNLALMEQSMVNWVTDLEKYNDWPNFKKIVTGESIVVDVKYSDPVEKEISTQLFINSNILPSLGLKRDGGYMRRLEFIPFERNFTGKDKDPYILSKLTQEDNLKWILSKVMAAAKELREDKNGTWFEDNEPQRVKEIKRLQAANDSSPLQFSEWLLNENGLGIYGTQIMLHNKEMSGDNGTKNQLIGEVSNKYGNIIYKTAMFNAYKLYCEFAQLHPVGRNNFERMVLDDERITLDAETRISKSRGFYKIKEIENVSRETIGGKNA